MNTILEKFVEAELYNEGIRAYFNGFTAYEDEVCGLEFKRMRQVQLGPYGIADIVNIVYPCRETPVVRIQVIECKRDMVNMATYAQAKRYLAALRMALQQFSQECEEAGFTVKWECILVGHRLELAGDFVYVLNDDPCCRVFTYERVDGELIFKKRAGTWGYHSDAPHPAHAALHSKVENELIPAWDRAEAEFLDFYSKYDKSGCPL